MAGVSEVELEQRAVIAADVATDMVLGVYEYPQGAHRGEPDGEGRYPINKTQLAFVLGGKDPDTAETVMKRPSFQRMFAAQLYRKQRNVLARMSDLEPVAAEIAKLALSDILLNLRDNPDSLDMKEKVQIAKMAVQLKERWAKDDDGTAKGADRMMDLMAETLSKRPPGDSVANAIREAQEKQLREAGLLMDGVVEDGPTEGTP